MTNLLWKKFPILNDGFICLSDYMGDDAKIASRARTSYGNDTRQITKDHVPDIPIDEYLKERQKDIDLLRRLMRDRHTSPFEFCEVEFLVRAPIYVFRQWHRHRTANINEYSGRYKEMIDSMETTPPGKWRLQSGKNKQGSDGYLTEWPEDDVVYQLKSIDDDNLQLSLAVSLDETTPGQYLTQQEREYHGLAQILYQDRLKLGIAKEQARKDLPVSNYSEMYWKCDLHNLLHFLSLRMDSHAQEEIRLYANQMGEIVKQLFPVTWQAFEDYRLNSMTLSALDIKAIQYSNELLKQGIGHDNAILDDIFTNKTEREECVAKLTKLGIL